MRNLTRFKVGPVTLNSYDPYPVNLAQHSQCGFKITDSLQMIGRSVARAMATNHQALLKPQPFKHQVGIGIRNDVGYNEDSGDRM